MYARHIFGLKQPVALLATLVLFASLPRFAAAQDAADPAAPPAGPAPKITSPAPEFDFGSVDNEQKVLHDFIIKNEGNATLEIARVKTTCGCTVAELKDKTLDPGEETQVSVTLSLKGKQGKQQKNLTVESNDPVHPVFRLALTGNAVSSVNLEPKSVSFGRLVNDEPVTQTIAITIDEKRRPIHITGVENTATDQFLTELKTIEDGGKYELVVTTAKGLAKGMHSARLSLKTDSPGLPVLTTSATAQVVGELEVSPQQVVLRYSEKPGDTTSQYLRVAPGRVATFQIKEVIAPTTTIQVEVTPRGKNDYLVRLMNMPLDGSLEGKELIIRTDVPSAPEIKVPFMVARPRVAPKGATPAPRPGRPVPPALAPSPNTVAPSTPAAPAAPAAPVAPTAAPAAAPAGTPASAAVGPAIEIKPVAGSLGGLRQVLNLPKGPAIEIKPVAGSAAKKEAEPK